MHFVHVEMSPSEERQSKKLQNRKMKLECDYRKVYKIRDGEMIKQSCSLKSI
jgi:hypothetical protein